MSDRSGVFPNEDVTLRVVVFGQNGQVVSADSPPDVYIYPPGIDPAVIQDEIDNSTFASSIDLALSVEVSPGMYQITYTVPLGQPAGEWHDVWIGTLNGVPISSIRTFSVVEEANFIEQGLVQNQVVSVVLSPNIADLDGNTLGEVVSLSFMTMLTPMYVTVSTLRMEAGPLVSYIPDDLLALMIFWSSLEVDHITPLVVCDHDQLCFAKGRLAMYNALLRALMSPGGSFVNGMHSGRNAHKMLGNFSIREGQGGNGGSMSGGLDKDTFDYLRRQRDEWERVVNSGACILPGGSFMPVSAIRGVCDPARRPPGRLWERSWENGYDGGMPTVNIRSGRSRERMWRQGYEERSYGDY